MRFDSKLITGAYLASRLSFYIARQGTPCTVYSFTLPTFSAKGAPSAVQYAAQPGRVVVMLQFGSEADDLATSLGVVDQQAAVGFVQAGDSGKIKDRDFIQDNAGQFFMARAIADAQPLGGQIVAARLLFVRTTKPPAGVS